MANFVSAKLRGNLVGAMDKLAAAAGESALRSAGVAGARVIRDEAIVRVPVDTGTIRRNIIMKHADERSDSNKRQTYLVTVRTGEHNHEGDAFYWRFVEGGHKIVLRKPKTANWKEHRAAMEREFGSARVPARPFLRPAFEEKKKEAINAMRRRLGEKIKENLGGVK